MKKIRSSTFSLISSVAFFVVMFLFGFWLAGRMQVVESYAGSFTGENTMLPQIDAHKPADTETALFALG